jgi:hypothetical protein
MRRRPTIEWMTASLAVALAITVLVRLVAGPGEWLVGALRATARWSFILFWLATVGGALSTLFGSRFRPLAQRARDLGLSYASAHLVHVGLVVWIFYYSIRHSLPTPPLRFFGIAVLWTYLIAILSFRPASALIGARATRIIRWIGVEYITLAFFVDFKKNPFEKDLSHIVSYAPFLVLTVAAPLLRLIAARKRSRERYHQTSLPTPDDRSVT